MESWARRVASQPPQNSRYKKWVLIHVVADVVLVLQILPVHHFLVRPSILASVQKNVLCSCISKCGIKTHGKGKNRPVHEDRAIMWSMQIMRPHKPHSRFMVYGFQIN